MRELKFEKAVRDFLNTKIGLFLSNHHYMEGNLLAVKQDHLVIDVDQNVHYIPLQQIKTLSKNTKDFNATSSIVPYLNRRYFTEVLNVMKYSWVTINGSDKDAQFGVLSKIAEDYIILINQKELLYIPIFFISNIHGVLSQQQIRLANENEKQTNQLALQTTTNAEEETINIHLPDLIEEPESYELLLERVPQKAELEEELQTVENGNHDQLGSTQQVEILLIHGVVNQGEDINVDSSQSSIPDDKLVIHDEAQLVQSEENSGLEDEEVIVLSEINPTIQEHETIVVSEVNPEIQEEEQIAVSVVSPEIHEQELITVSVASPESHEQELIAVSVANPESQEEELIAVSVASPESHEEELIAVSVASPEIQKELFVEEIEPIHLEKTLDGLETDSLEDLTHRVPNLLDYDEDESDVWGILETTFNSRTVESFSFDEPLGYERDFPISFWKTREQDQQTITNDSNVAQEEESFTHSIQLQDVAKPVELLDTSIAELLSTEDAVNDNYASIIDEEAQPSKSNNASITIIRISMKDEKEILEEQYFSLAKHAANYSQNNRRKNPVDNLSKGNETVDGQYISLMNHAAKMYQQLLDK